MEKGGDFGDFACFFFQKKDQNGMDGEKGEEEGKFKESKKEGGRREEECVCLTEQQVTR